MFVEFMLSVIKEALLEVGEPQIVSVCDKSDTRLCRIYEFLETYDYIMNSDVQKLLGVSSATATRILTQFAKSGKLKRVRIQSHWGYVKA